MTLPYGAVVHSIWSRSRPGTVYYVLAVQDGEGIVVTCPCRGGVLRDRCWHGDEVMRRIEKGVTTDSSHALAMITDG